MKVLTFASVLALWVVTQGAHAQDQRTTQVREASRASQTSTDAAESAAMADKAREKAEALERARDLRLRRATQSICIGC